MTDRRIVDLPFRNTILFCHVRVVTVRFFTGIFSALDISANTGRLANGGIEVQLEVAQNDDPYGLFGFPENSREISIAEDYYPGQEATTQATFTVERRQGTLGHIQVRILYCVGIFLCSLV